MDSMTQPWFRFYRAVVNSPKVQRLAPPLFKAWVNMLCCTLDDGSLPTPGDLAFTLRTTEKQVVTWLQALAVERLMLCCDGVWIAHDWDTHQPKSDSSRERTAAMRERRKAVTSDAGVTVSVTSHVTGGDAKSDGLDTETEQNRGEESARAARRAPERGSRIPPDFIPAPPTDTALAIAQRIGRERYERETARFKDHWSAASGASSIKRDWNAAFRLWLSRAEEYGPSNARGSPSGVNLC